jgi:hypothetical protein
VAAGDREPTARAVEQAARCSPRVRTGMVPSADTIFATSRPGTVVLRTGIGFDNGREGADTTQQQWAGRQHSIACGRVSWHCAAAGSHNSDRVGKLPMTETASSVVTTFETVGICL